MSFEVWDALARSPPPDPFPVASIARLSAALSNLETCREVSHDARYPTLLGALLQQAINADDISTKSRVSALVCLVHLSRVDDPTCRALLLDYVLRIEQPMDDLLQEKEGACSQFDVPLGRQHEYVVVLLLRCTNFKIKASQLLHDLCGGRCNVLVKIILSVFKVPSYEQDVRVKCLAILHALTIPSTYYATTEEDDDAQKPQKSPLRIGVTEFPSKVDALLDVCVSMGLLRELISALESRPDPLPLKAVALLCRFIENVHWFSSRGSSAVAWRQSIIVATPSLLCPILLSTILKTLQDRRAVASLDDDETSALAAAFRVLSLTTYSAPIALIEKHILTNGAQFVWPICDAMMASAATEVVLSKLPLYASFLQFLINSDAIVGFAAPPPSASQGASNSSPSSDEDPSLTTKIAGRLSAFLIQMKETAASAWVSSVCNPVGGSVPTLLAQKSSSYEMLCQLYNGALSQHQKEKPAPGSETAEGGIFPVSREAEQEALDDLQKREDALRSNSPESQSLQESKSLLGDLPAIDVAKRRTVTAAQPPTQAREEKKQQAKRAAKGASLVPKGLSGSPHPQKYLCCLSGQLMRVPVRLPSGNVFEQAALEAFMKDFGHLDPVTMTPFQTEPAVDVNLQKEIAEYIIATTLQDAMAECE